VTIGKVTLGGAGGSRRLDPLLLDDLFEPLTSKGIKIVDLSPRVVAASKREQQLSDDGRLATRVNYQPLKPTYEITGDGTQLRDGRVTMTLNLKNLVTGQTVATKTATGKGRTFGQLRDLLEDLSSDFSGDATEVIDKAPTGGAVTVDLEVSFIDEGTGSGTVTASPPGKTLNKASSTTTYEYKVAGGTTVSLQAKPDPGSYFLGWQSGSECGGDDIQSSDLDYPCTVTDPGPDQAFIINVGANFDSCPPPGTHVLNEPNATACPGVIVYNN
jgi:hypothetical protein